MGVKGIVLSKGEVVARKVTKEEVKNTAEKLADYLVVRGRENIVSHMEIARFLAKLMPGKDITYALVGQYVSMAREASENRHGKTFRNVRSEGWMVANESEKAVYMVRSAHRAIKLAERTNRLYVITDKRLIPVAIEKVFGSRSKASEMLKMNRRGLGLIFKGV